jgi:hypothetical protein
VSRIPAGQPEGETCQFRDLGAVADVAARIQGRYPHVGGISLTILATASIKVNPTECDTLRAVEYGRKGVGTAGTIGVDQYFLPGHTAGAVGSDRNDRHLFVATHSAVSLGSVGASLCQTSRPSGVRAGPNSQSVEAGEVPFLVCARCFSILRHGAKQRSHGLQVDSRRTRRCNRHTEVCSSAVGPVPFRSEYSALLRSWRIPAPDQCWNGDSLTGGCSAQDRLSQARRGLTNHWRL